jgi:hypothetical protein
MSPERAALLLTAIIIGLAALDCLFGGGGPSDPYGDDPPHPLPSHGPHKG